MKVDVIIPVYKPQKRFLELLSMLEKQTLPVSHIILMNTEKAQLERLISEEELLRQHPKIILTHITKEEFDHGATRNAGIRQSDAEVFVCMTQDALPADEFLLEKLVAALTGQTTAGTIGETTAGTTAAKKQSANAATELAADAYAASAEISSAYARQLPEADCSVIEQYTRQFNYPEQSFVKSAADIPGLGIKTFFCSNVCAAYKREIFEKLGGFASPTIFNEDMIYAARCIRAGYKIAYAAEAKVIHSHNYTGVQQFARNFDLGVSHVQYPEIFADVPPEGEGMKLVKQTAVYLMKQHPLMLPKLVWHSGMKFFGYRLGKQYRKLPKRLVKKCSMQKNYW